MKSSVSGLFEVVWFVLGGLMLFMAVSATLDHGIGKSWYYFLLAILAYVMYYLRRRMRLPKR
jgi:hypothetical protein